MKKGTTVFQNLKLLQLCARYEILPVWNLLVGFPGEREETYRRYVDTLPLLFHLPPPSGVFPVRFDRFSPYHTRAETYGLDLYPMDFYSLVYPFSDADLKNFAYYFNDRNANAEYRAEMVKWLAPMQERVDAWHARWNPSGQEPPRLYWVDGCRKIYDSRSGSIVEQQLGETASLVLERLSIPLVVAELIKQLAIELDRDVSTEVALLEEKGLVFRENDRMLSLVFKEKSQKKFPTAVTEDLMRVAGDASFSHRSS
jgi:magnesium-protoporphyrin IX monomethyl ester (oxidative) cyclase